jgi:hypothetical protein
MRATPLCFAFSLWLLGQPALAAQMPKGFHGEWRAHTGATDPWIMHKGYEPFCGLHCYEAGDKPDLAVTADGVETQTARCAATSVTKLGMCRHGPSYKIKLRCKTNSGGTFNVVLVIHPH